ncbi:cellulose biosynthesis cyclic di-GMP-binding regulatory protein BcsB [Pseudomonas sp. DTU_2021_1001937_2_SI_NGA_ILE_001]|uniref:cellulose biosynthesis cyclic di-GMP-binding regulatory protein BcsB n=1 Tax=Pseudomonas sp. DTU_2021_1001937_2_SI_NGA_ILE_001 TaxID=3077589 RepID=UPI00397D9235
MTFIPQGVARVLASAAGLLMLAPGAVLAADSPLSQALAQLDANLRQEREISLKDLGIRDAIVLSTEAAKRELYLPVPAGIPLSDATLNFNASYLNSERGRNTLLLSLDGYPVNAQGLNDPQGDASVTLGVDKSARPSGSVRLGMAWSASTSQALCEDERAIGNVLRVEPDTRLRYSYDASQLHDIGVAWNALPGQPGLLVAPGPLSTASFDAAWRLGVALERVGKQARILPLPAVGDTLLLDGLKVPEALRSVPAFASLNGQGRYTLQNVAEVGALLVLGQTANVQADLAVADAQLSQALDAALEALQAQVQAVDAQAARALGKWRERHLQASVQALGQDDIRLAMLGSRPVLSIAPGATGKAISLLDAAWNRLARSSQLSIAQAQRPPSQDGRIALASLGTQPATLQVLSSGDWTTTFPLGYVAGDGRLPVRAVIDVTAAPGASDTAPVLSLFLNDYLIGAAQLVTDGQQQRLEARIPAYALGSRNVLRVFFQRQPVSNRCRETPQAFPVTVLPTSHLVLEPATPSANFAGMAARFAGDSQVLVPQAWLEQAASRLPTLIKVADATGVSPLHAQLQVQAAGPAQLTPERPFLAFDLPPKDTELAVQADAQGRLLIKHKAEPWLQIQPLDQLAALQVIDAGQQHGVLYTSLGAHPAAPEKALLLGRGDASIIGAEGSLATFSTQDPNGNLLVQANEPVGLDAWRQPSRLWLIPGALLALLVIVLAGRRARRKRQ